MDGSLVVWLGQTRFVAVRVVAVREVAELPRLPLRLAASVLQAASAPWRPCQDSAARPHQQQR